MDGTSGSNSYKLIEELFKKSTELMIISPFISKDYANLLLNYSQSKRVRIILSNSKSNMAALEVLNIKTNVNGSIKLFLFLFILLSVSIILNFTATSLFLLIFIILLLIYIINKKKSKGSNLHIKVPKGKFVHEKLYIGNNYAIAGSANLTYSGMHKNIEYMRIINNQDELKRLKEHFNSLWYMFN